MPKHKTTATPPTASKSRKKTLPHIKRLAELLGKAKGTEKHDMERILAPVAKAFGEHEKSRKELVKQVDWFYSYLNGQLNFISGDYYPEEEIKKIAEILQGAKKAFEEYGIVGLETCEQHLDEAAVALSDLLERGPIMPAH